MRNEGFYESNDGPIYPNSYQSSELATNDFLQRAMKIRLRYDRTAIDPSEPSYNLENLAKTCEEEVSRMKQNIQKANLKTIQFFADTAYVLRIAARLPSSLNFQDN